MGPSTTTTAAAKSTSCVVRSNLSRRLGRHVPLRSQFLERALTRIRGSETARGILGPASIDTTCGVDHQRQLETKVIARSSSANRITPRATVASMTSRQAVTKSWRSRELICPSNGTRSAMFSNDSAAFSR